MKIKFITSIYSDLYGSDFGGRQHRYGHYRYSLLSLLKMTDADFLCYTSDREIEDLQNFFYILNSIPQEKLEFRIQDLSNIKSTELINKYKNKDSVVRSDRCTEIQYSKFHWWWNEDRSYDYYYWIDAGLSHCGLIPLKYLPNKEMTREFYESTLFNNNFLHNLIEDTGDKFLILGKENDRNFWDGTVDPKWYIQYDRSIHIIGGLFGGHRDRWDEIVNLFENYTNKCVEDGKHLYFEENIMSLMWVNHKDLFVRKHFDIWWCPDSGPRDANPEIYVQNKSFFSILEEFNRIYE